MHALYIVDSRSNTMNDNETNDIISMEMPPRIPTVNVDGLMNTPGMSIDKVQMNNINTAGGDHGEMYLDLDDSDSL